jgi:alkanesulfonate monooxygenase SsuD/methylene tetrahydromethanopterin reductase-like flavin-dependent oxidoreductase (luciferase family)
VRFSIWPSLAQPWADVLEVTRHAEVGGWDGVYVADHFMGDGGGFGAVETPTLEGTAALAALGATTDRLRLGTLVLSATYRHPAVLANWAATVDLASGGRLTLGLGAGWQENEHAQYGIDLGSPRERLDRFEEACQVWAGLLRRPTTTVEGRYYRLTDAIAEPKPVQDPLPLLIGGKGDRMMGIVARYADEWNMWGLAPAIAERLEVLARRCEAIDRDPASIAHSAQALVLVTDDAEQARSFLEAAAGRAAVAGPPSAFAEACAAWQDAGLDEVIVPDFTLGRGQRRLDAMDQLLGAVSDFR